MRLYPRMIEIGDEDSDEYSFKIKNSSVEERHLLFKVRRSERKMVDFEPKQGVVAPGSTLKVRLWVCDRCIHSSRLLVKLVSLKSAYMTEDFLQSWEIATKRGGEVKKVIDLKRTRAKEDSMQQLLEHSSLLVDTKISEVSNPHRQMISLNSAKKTMENLSPSSSLASISDMDSYTNPVEEAIQSLKQRLLHQSSQIFSGRHNSIEDHTHTCEVASHKNSQQGTGHKRTGSADNSEMDLSTSFEFPPSISTFASESKKSTKHIDAKNDTNFALSTILQKLQLSEDFIKPVLAEISDDARYDERSILAGIALALQNFSMVSSLSPTFPDKMTNSGLIQNRTLVSERISPGKKESITTFHRPVNARLIALGSSKYPEKEKNNDHFGSAGVVIEISGSPYRLDNGSVLDIDDLEESNEEEGLAPLTKSLLRETLQNLIIESNSQRKRVAAVQVEHAQISSISDCFSNLFACDKSQSQIEEKLNSMRALYLEDNLKHISLNSSPLMVGIDCSINKFRSLLTLNLSGNKIAKIEGPLDLPSLHLLDISHNNFASFDYLQLLINLRTLVASYNKIHSLHMSVNMLVSLSRTLTSLDLSHNPVCNDANYAEEVVQILPKLRFFDRMDLTLFSRSYSASSRGTLNQVNQNLRSRTVTNKMASGKARKPLTPSAKIPALPAEEKQSIIDGGVQFQIKLRRAMQSRDRKIRSNQTEDLGCSNDEWTSDGDGYTTGSYSSNIARNSRQHGIYLQSKMNAARKAVEVENDCKSYSETYGIGNRNIPLRNSEREKLALEKFEERKVDSPLSQHFFSVEKESNSSHVPMQNSMEIPETPDRKERTKLHIDLSRSLTASSTGRRKSQMQSLIPHWSGQSQDSNDAVQNAEISQNFNTPTPYLHQHVGGHEKLYHSNLLELTGSLKMRRKSFGIVSKSDIGHSEEQTNANGRGYHSEGDFSYISQKSRSVRGSTTINAQKFIEMQEEERYGIWHPRYRVPKPVFGFSKPFAKRPPPKPKAHAPLFVNTVERIRNGFEKLPTRGTFSRASKGLTAEWYPMDYTDLEAIRRQGYFHQTIGTIQKYSYRDSKSNSPNRDSADQQHASTTFTESFTSNTGAPIKDSTGNVAILPSQKTRRGSIGQHISRQYRKQSNLVNTSTTSATDQNSIVERDISMLAHPSPDNFSGFRKWHADFFSELKEAKPLPLEGQSVQKLDEDTKLIENSFTNPVIVDALSAAPTLFDEESVHTRRRSTVESVQKKSSSIVLDKRNFIFPPLDTSHQSPLRLVEDNRNSLYHHLASVSPAIPMSPRSTLRQLFGEVSMNEIDLPDDVKKYSLDAETRENRNSSMIDHQSTGDNASRFISQSDDVAEANNIAAEHASGVRINEEKLNRDGSAKSSGIPLDVGADAEESQLSSYLSWLENQ